MSTEDRSAWANEISRGVRPLNPPSKHDECAVAGCSHERGRHAAGDGACMAMGCVCHGFEAGV